ncbi:hypothetical protein [Paraglaciecola sp.]|uniref:hypothetical protein n=1 Tax=Paraglaciecola sp. TaxID=1920173 RepID=UPI0030F45A6D
MIAIVIIGLSRSSSKLVDTHIRRAQTEAFLDAGINRLIVGLLDSRSHWKIDGIPREFVFSGQKLQLTAWYERGKYDLNYATESSLMALFKAAGASESDASTSARAITELRASGGQTAKLFHSVTEVRSIPKISSNLYCQVAPSLTVYSQQTEPDNRVASGLVLSVLANIGSDRRTDFSNVLPENSAISGLEEGGQAVTLRAELTSESHIRKGLTSSAKEIVIRFTGNVRQPVWQLAVRDGLDEIECRQHLKLANYQEAKRSFSQKK